MSWTPTQADHVAAQHVRLWLSEGLTPAEMVQAVGGSYPEATLDDAHHAVAAAWEGLYFRLNIAATIPFRQGAF